MDEPTSRARSASRRMASAKPAATTRGRSPARGSRKSDEPDISRARWAGVALVIAAIVAAIFLAVISPSDPGAVPQPGVTTDEPAPTPVPSILDTCVPTAQPRIVSPLPESTAEYEIPVIVDVPEEDLGRKNLTLVILRGDEVLKRYDAPKPDSRVTVEGVSLLKGAENELTAVLEGPGGLRGPRSNPVLVTHDPEAPSLAIVSPEKGEDTYEKTILLVGTSEVGAEVRIRNEANGWGPRKRVVGPDGEFKQSVPLKTGRNLIVVESEDQTKQTRTRTVRVVRKDGQPRVTVNRPKSIDKSMLPRKIQIKVKVTDDKGDPMEGATVAYTLGAPDRLRDTFEEETGANGKSAWTPLVERSSSAADALELGVTVTSPWGYEDEQGIKIPFS